MSKDIENGMDMDKMISDRAKLSAQLSDLDLELNAYLKALMGKRSKILNKIDDITKEKIAPLQEELGPLVTEIERVIKKADIESYKGDDQYNVSQVDKISFSATNWDKLYDFQKEYDGEFDANSLIKKALNSTAMKKYYDAEGKCPPGTVEKTYKDVSFRKK